MKSIKSKMGLTILAMVFVIGLSAQTQTGNGNNNTGKKYHANKECQYHEHQTCPKTALNLTDDQNAQIEKIKAGYQKAMLPLRNELGEKKARLNTLQTAEKADMKAINSTIDEMSAIRAKMAKAKAAQHQEVRNLLTEEQRLQFDLHAMNKKGRNGHCPNN